jgi:hypothetical protein
MRCECKDVSLSKCMIHLGKFDQPDEMIYDGKNMMNWRINLEFCHLGLKFARQSIFFGTWKKAPSGFF